MNIKRDVFKHVEKVSDGDASEDEVDGVGSHVLVRENHDVDDVEDASEDTNIQRKMSVDRSVQILK